MIIRPIGCTAIDAIDVSEQSSFRNLFWQVIVSLSETNHSSIESAAPSRTIYSPRWRRREKSAETKHDVTVNHGRFARKRDDMFSNETADFKKLELSPGFKISVITVLVLETVLGTVASCTVLLTYWNKRTVRSVATKFIANLALTDLIICCVCVPLTIARLAGFPRYSTLFCCWHEAVTSGLRNASFITLLLICYDRYKSVTNPFVLRLNHREAKRALLLVWFLTTVSLAAPFVEWKRRAKNPWSLSCIVMFSKSEEPFYVRLYYLPSFALACTILLPAYLKISKAALTRVNIQAMMVRTSFIVPATKEQRLNQTIVRQKEWKIAKMTGAVVCSVCGLWLPYTTLTFALHFVVASNLLARLEFVFLALGYFNCVLNPLLYAFTKEKFRTAFIRTLPCKKKQQFSGN